MSVKSIERKRWGGARRLGGRHWVVALTTFGALVAYTSGDSRSIMLARVRQSSVATQSTIEQERRIQTQTYRFDIPAGTLDTVLTAFERVTGARMEIPNATIRELASPGVNGMFTMEEALRKILAGTGVAYRFSSPATLLLELEGVAESVSVTGERAELSSPRYVAPLRDIPQTVTVIPRAVIEQQGATTLRDVLRNVSGLTIAAGEGGAPAGDNLTLRGFSARNDVFVDGVRDLGPQSRDAFNLEQVEVVRGPASAYTGRGSTGGTINLVSKSPSASPFYNFTLDFGTDRTKRVAADINTPLARFGFGERAAFRLNFMAHDAGVAGRDAVENERWGVAPSLAFGLGTTMRLTLSYFHLEQNNISDYGIPWVPVTNNALVQYRDRPAPVPRETFYGFRTRDRERTGSDLATVRFERDFSDTLTMRHQFRYGRSTRDSMATPPRFASNDSTVINREMRSWLTTDSIFDNQTDFNASFRTGSIQHRLVAGLAFTRETNTRQTRTAPNATTTLLNPNPNDVYTGAITLSPIVGDITANSQSLYVFDTASVGERWQFIGGARWDRFDAGGTNITGASVDRVDRMTSFRVGAVFNPTRRGSIYAAYGTSLNPSLEGLSYNVANTAIDPERTYTFEIGSKWELFGGRALFTGSAFRVDKTNARTPGLTPDEPPQVLEGRQRVDGVELGLSGRITRAWSLNAAYTLLDSEIVESNIPAEVGRRLINTPRDSFNVWTTYSFPRNFNIGGGARFVGRRYGNNTNTRQVEGYWLLDLMASYPLSRHVEMRLNIYNLTDEYYFDRLAGGHVVPGASRSATLSTSFRF